MLEAYTTLGFLARATERIDLGPLVVGVHFRHPGALVKQATTLDVLAAARAHDARPRSGLVRPRGARPRIPLPSPGRALRPARGDAPDRPGDVRRRPRRRSTGRPLPARGADQRPGAALRGRGRGSWSVATGPTGRPDWLPATPTPATSSTPIRARAAGWSTRSDGDAEDGRPRLRRDRDDLPRRRGPAARPDAPRPISSRSAATRRPKGSIS